MLSVRFKIINIEFTRYRQKQLKKQLKPTQLKKVFPGVLTSLGDGYLIKEDLLQQKIALNRKYGFEGECFFYFEFLKKINHIY